MPQQHPNKSPEPPSESRACSKWNHSKSDSIHKFHLFLSLLSIYPSSHHNSNWKSKCPETSTPQKTRLQIGIHSKSHFFPWTPWLEKREKCPLQTQIHRERSNKQKHHRQHLTSIERNRFGKSNATQAMNPTFQCTNPKKKKSILNKTINHYPPSRGVQKPFQVKNWTEPVQNWFKQFLNQF